MISPFSATVSVYRLKGAVLDIFEGSFVVRGGGMMGDGTWARCGGGMGWPCLYSQWTGTLTSQGHWPSQWGFGCAIGGERRHPRSVTDPTASNPGCPRKKENARCVNALMVVGRQTRQPLQDTGGNGRHRSTSGQRSSTLECLVWPHGRSDFDRMQEHRVMWKSLQLGNQKC